MEPKKIKLTQERLKELLHYSPETGLFTRLKSVKGHTKGTQAGWRTNKGYIQIGIDYQKVVAHRLAFLYMTGSIPNMIDHINQNKEDNRWHNLRVADKSKNQVNKGLQSNNTSGYKGVTFNKGRGKPWIAQTHVNGKHKYLGIFDCSIEAAIAYDIAVEREYGEFAQLNFPMELIRI